MNNLRIEMKRLKESVVEMAGLALNQLEKSKDAFLNMDTEIAHEVILREARMNGLELLIDRDCENIFALFNPVATDLRFIIAALKINSDLERIGDYADGIADYVVEFNTPINPDLIAKTRLEEMFDIAISMMQDITTALEEENGEQARKILQKDAELNQINKVASKIISEFTKSNPETSRQSLFLFSTIMKVERVGDHIKNIVEDLIFYLEAEILKHQKHKPVDED